MSNFKLYLEKAQGHNINSNEIVYLNENFRNYIQRIYRIDEKIAGDVKTFAANNKKFLKNKAFFENKFIEIVAFPKQDKFVLSIKQNDNSPNTHDGEQIDIINISKYAESISEIIYNNEKLNNYQELKDKASKESNKTLTGPKTDEKSLQFKIGSSAIQKIVQEFFAKKGIKEAKINVDQNDSFFISNKKTEIKIFTVDLTTDGTINDTDLENIENGQKEVKLLDIKIKPNGAIATK